MSFELIRYEKGVLTSQGARVVVFTISCSVDQWRFSRFRLFLFVFVGCLSEMREMVMLLVIYRSPRGYVYNQLFHRPVTFQLFLFVFVCFCSPPRPALCRRRWLAGRLLLGITLPFSRKLYLFALYIVPVVFAGVRLTSRRVKWPRCQVWHGK